MPSLSLVFTVCAFASGFAMRTIDPLILPIAQRFAVTPATAALLATAFALPYALVQPFLGPLGDRFGKARCIRICATVMTMAIAAGAVAPSFGWLLASRLVAGGFAGGIIPLVLAGLGDAYALQERQVAMGRMLVVIISGQMLGSAASGLIGDAFGWRSALAVAAAIALLATASSAWSLRAASPAANAPAGAAPSFRALYAQVFANPKAPWLYGAVVCEGALVCGLFPYVGQLLVAHGGSGVEAAPSQAGLVLGAFGIGGILYGLTVRRLIQALGVRRMCAVGSVAVAAVYALLAWLPAWWLHVLAMVVCGIGYYMLHNSLQIEATELAPSARGSAVALFACGFFVGVGLGPLLFGALLHATGFTAALSAIGLGLIVLGRVIVGRVVR
ncbi:MAG TPA: MFS transporter [Burkholderiaceae bacterium]|nr:MFS transporter [Burkholderiaceae bacterium]